MTVTIEHIILLITILAIIISPIIALSISTKLQDRKEARERRYNILRSLMATRRARLDSEHVKALNLVELEFYHAVAVRDAHKSYMNNLASPLPSEKQSQDKLFDDRDDLFASLLAEIAKTLDYSFDKSDLARLSYQPQAFADNFEDQLANSRLLRSVLEGQRAIPIVNFVQASGLHPPVPKKQEPGETD